MRNKRREGKNKRRKEKNKSRKEKEEEVRDKYDEKKRVMRNLMNRKKRQLTGRERERR